LHTPMPRSPSPGPSEVEPSTISARRIETKVLSVNHLPYPLSEGAKIRRPLGETKHVKLEVNVTKVPSLPSIACVLKRS